METINLDRKSKSASSKLNSVPQLYPDDGDSYSVHDVPPEILEKIFIYLNGKDLLNSRAVSTQWKAVLSHIMEQKVLSYYSVWSFQSGDDKVNCIIPRLRLIVNLPTFNEKDNIPRVQHWNEWCARLLQGSGLKFLKTICPLGLENRFGNPFPSSALRFKRETYNPDSATSYHEEQEIYEIFQKYGHYLTTVVVDGYSGSISNFANLLHPFPNLKLLAIKFKLNNVENVNSKWDVGALPFLSNLTHLRLSMHNEPLFWLLEKYAEQLVGLSVCGIQNEELAVADMEKLSKKIQFRNLEQLKVVLYPDNTIFKLVGGAQLTHIVLKDYVQRYDRLDFYFQTIHSFSESLVHLRFHLPFLLGESKGVYADVYFPNVKKLSVKFPLYAKEINMIKKEILPRFPAVEKLEFFEITKINEFSEVENSAYVEEYRKVCPKLKEISTISRAQFWKV